jgi:hypothetical protein
MKQLKVGYRIVRGWHGFRWFAAFTSIALVLPRSQVLGFIANSSSSSNAQRGSVVRCSLAALRATRIGPIVPAVGMPEKLEKPNTHWRIQGFACAGGWAVAVALYKWTTQVQPTPEVVIFRWLSSGRWELRVNLIATGLDGVAPPIGMPRNVLHLLSLRAWQAGGVSPSSCQALLRSIPLRKASSVRGTSSCAA